MKHLIFVSILLVISILGSAKTVFSQEQQESYTLLLMDFEDKSGVQNPLLSAFNETTRSNTSQRKRCFHRGELANQFASPVRAD